MRHSGDGEVGNLHSERKERGGVPQQDCHPSLPRCPTLPLLSAAEPRDAVSGALLPRGSLRLAAGSGCCGRGCKPITWASGLCKGTDPGWVLHARRC